MFILNKFVTITLMVFAAVACCKSDAVEMTDIETNTVETNPGAVAVLTQLKSIKSDSYDAVYTYKCTVGRYTSNRVACTAQDSTSWGSPHNVELKLRCPKSGSTAALSYVEIVYSVSSQSVNCYVNEGAVGWGYIGMTLNAYNTLLFSYTAHFYI